MGLYLMVFRSSGAYIDVHANHMGAENSFLDMQVFTKNTNVYHVGAVALCRDRAYCSTRKMTHSEPTTRVAQLTKRNTGKQLKHVLALKRYNIVCLRVPSIDDQLNACATKYSYDIEGQKYIENFVHDGFVTKWVAVDQTKNRQIQGLSQSVNAGAHR